MTIAFYEVFNSVRNLSDAELVQSIRWKRKTADSLKSAADAGDVLAVAKILQRRMEHLTECSAVNDIASRYLSAWSLPSFDHTTPRMSLGHVVFPPEALLPAGAQNPADEVPTLSGKKSRRHASKEKSSNEKKSRKRSGSARRINPSELTEWLKSARDGEPLSYFEQLVLAEVVCFHAQEFDAEYFFDLWRLLFESSINLGALDADDCPEVDAYPDRHLIIHGELCFRAGLIFRDVVNSSRLMKAGRNVLNSRLNDETDIDGVPHAGLYDRLALWIAPLVRSDLWGEWFDKRVWDADGADRFPELVRQATRLATPLGSLIGCDCAMSASMLDTALDLIGHRKKSAERAFLASLISRQVGSRGKKKKQTGADGKTKRAVNSAGDPFTFQSDWGDVACLRNRLVADADSLLVRYADERPALDFAALGVPVLSGDWDIAVRIDGQDLELATQWTCSCWQSDKDGDYIELTADEQDGVRIERQIFLSRMQHFALFTDSVVAADDAIIDLTSSLPPFCEIDGEHDVRTREIRRKL